MSSSAEEITVFTAPGCVWCGRTVEWLKERGVEFQERNVAADQQAAAEMVRLTGQHGVPVIAANGEVIIGFDQTRLERMINRTGRQGRRPTLGLLARDAPGPQVEIGGTRLGSRAEKAGFQKGDVLESVGGQPVQSMAQLEESLSNLPEDSQVEARVRRGEDIEVLTIPS